MLNVGVSYASSKYITNYGASVIDLMIAVGACDNKSTDSCLSTKFSTETTLWFIPVLAHIMECDPRNHSVFIAYSKFFDGCKYSFLSFICKTTASR